MKKLVFVFLFICSHVIAQQKKEIKPGASLRLNGKKLNYVYVGNENLYAFKYEISNENYLEFLYDIRKTKGEAEYQRNLPDTTVWKTPLGSIETYVKHYLRHPSFRDYPVVGVSYEQAENFCNWLTELMNNYCHDKKIKKIRIRLPTEEEWEIAARGGLPKGTIFPWGTESIRSEKRKYKGAHLALSAQYSAFEFMSDGANITSRVSEFWPNNYGLYNMAGNVAEMVAEKSICKGGAWNKGPNKLVISSRDTFEVAAPWVGFRIFAEIEEYHIAPSDIKIDAKYISNNLYFVPRQKINLPNFEQPRKRYRDTLLESFYISKFEVSNELYLHFLNSINDVSKQKKFFPNDENWSSETDILQYQHYTKQFPNYPVVNISKEAMIAFCDWLTEQYNKDPKRKYEKVQFNLPSSSQQLLASSGGESIYMYSFGGPYVRNSKCEFMMNFNPLLDYVAYDEDKLSRDLEFRSSQLSILKKSRALDGYELSAPVDSYKACGKYFEKKELKDTIQSDIVLKDKDEKQRKNSIRSGIHNLNGNVAEAVIDSEIVFGGSFASMGQNCLNFPEDIWSIPLQRERISLPSPQVGFRFVMTGINELRKD